MDTLTDNSEGCRSVWDFNKFRQWLWGSWHNDEAVTI